MSGVALNPILEQVFRSNPAYELTPFDRLPASQQELLKELTNDPDFYGVLLPRAPGPLSIKSVCRNTALLLQTMTRTGLLPQHLLRTLGDAANQAVAELVLDGVLEIEIDGRFVSGPEAYPFIYPSRERSQPQGLLPRLSLAALKYAQALEIDDVARLSSRLYLYNRLPLTRHWASRCHSREAVSEFLAISVHKSLRTNWIPVESTLLNDAWFLWHSRLNQPVARQHRKGYKLYVSPLPAELPAAFRAVVSTLDNSAAHSFKVGSNAMGLLRPDKFVLYFWDFESLTQVARDLTRALSGCAAHGVPFTAALAEDGLLSWGIDPRPEKDALAWAANESWRFWVTNRLAAALVSVRNNSHGSLQPWQFALERLRLQHVDTDTWTPTRDFDLAPA